MSKSDVPPAESTEDAGSSPTPTASPTASMSLVGRLFGVPLLIVLFIVGSVTVVVTGFGWIATSQQRSIESLLATLEAGGGAKNAFGMLAPRDKEYWQAAQELAERLKRKDAEVPAEQRPQVAARLAAMIRKSGQDSLAGPGRVIHQFLMLALARLGDPGGIDALVEQLSASDAGIRRIAVQALVELRDVPGIDRAVPAVIERARDRDQVVRMVACNVLGQIARAEDTEAIAALTEALTAGREVQWNAAVALGHLGCERAAVPLASMLERSFWEGVVHRVESADGPQEQPLTPTAVRAYLIAAMRSASCLHDARLDLLIAALQEDRDSQVRQAAQDLLGASSEPAT